MFIRTKRHVLVNLGSALWISKAGSDDLHVTMATEKHFVKIRAVEGTADQLLDKITAAIAAGQHLLEVDAVID